MIAIGLCEIIRVLQGENKKHTRTSRINLTTYNQAINFNTSTDTYFKVPTQIHKGASFF